MERKMKRMNLKGKVEVFESKIKEMFVCGEWVRGRYKWRNKRMYGKRWGGMGNFIHPQI